MSANVDSCFSALNCDGHRIDGFKHNPSILLWAVFVILNNRVSLNPSSVMSCADNAGRRHIVSQVLQPNTEALHLLTLQIIKLHKDVDFNQELSDLNCDFYFLFF